MPGLNWKSIAITFLVFAGSFGLTFGLTYLPCYSAICVEKHFALNTRIHLGAFYGLILAAGSVHIAYRRFKLVRDSLNMRAPDPILSWLVPNATLGQLLVVLSTIGFVAACQGYFWEDEKEFYEGRGLSQANTTLGTTRLAIVGTTGHMCDFLLGLVVIPISRDSILRTTLELDVGALLWFHKFIGYFLFFVVCIHTIVFYSWVPVFAKAEMPLKDVFGIDNPTMAQHEVDENAYYATVLASGMISLAIFIAIIVTSVPKRIRQNYNTFYYTHLLSILFFILTAIHASTDFYLLLPGLLLWLIDWFNRFRGLKILVDARLRQEGNGWYRITIPSRALPKQYSQQSELLSDQLLTHFYITVPAVSKWQTHPYTVFKTIDNEDIICLFRVSNIGKKENKQQKEWTVKLAGLLHNGTGVEDIELGSSVNGTSAALTSGRTIETVPIKLRLSPPYMVPHNPFASYDTILCIVGGTGITGALSLASAFLRLHSNTKPGQSTVVRCLRIMWSIRETDDADLLDVQAIMNEARVRNVDLSFSKCITGNGRDRLDFEYTLKEHTSVDIHGRTWVYLSGPSAFMDAGEYACVVGKKAGMNIDWHCAKWDV